MEPGSGSPIVTWIFYVLVVLLFGIIGLFVLRTLVLMAVLWIMPVARMCSIVPPVRRWIERKTGMSATADLSASPHPAAHVRTQSSPPTTPT